MAARGSTIICDTCGGAEVLRVASAYTGTDDNPAPPPTYQARADAAKKIGWRFTADPDGGWVVTCPVCLEKERQAIADAWPPERRLAFIAATARTARSDLTRALASAGDDPDAIRAAYGDAFDALSRITLVATERPDFLEHNAEALGMTASEEPAAARALVAGDKPVSDPSAAHIRAET